MHSHLLHHHTTTTTGNNHFPPHMLLQALSSSYTTTTNNPSPLLDQHTFNDSFSSSSASINHKEAEKRRRERINFHLNRLRTILPCNSKTDKASLLAKVVERLRELKQTTSEMDHHESIPSETDEITVISSKSNVNDKRIIIKASMCCEDRSDLLADMIQTLTSLQLSPVRVEMVAVGGRIRNIILVECDCEKDDCGMLVQCVREALSCLVASNLGSNQSSKRRRMMVCA
ncbi:putative transcription factor bHLH family [Helianthus debilis subsp. tardiflorus]